jgi:uncharacterized paraquat-inducible protein A
MKCPNCKFENDETKNICLKCGYPINSEIKMKLSYKKMFLILGCVYVFLEGLYFVINFLFKG